MLDNIGKYKLRRQVGRGAMGIVYEAWDTQIDRRVALKMLRTDRFEDTDLPGMLARFKREAQSVGRLSHPHIVSIFDYGEWQGTPYLVMEFMEGRDLAQELKTNARFPVEVVVRIMTQMLSALGHAHDRGVVHRDLKPGNMFLLEDGSLKLVDFGLARIEDAELTHLTNTGTVLGTPAYMSPEQVEGLPVDHRSDLFSAGVILYELLSGENPFKGDSTYSTQQRVRKLDPLPPSEMNPTVSPAWDQVIASALAKKPLARYDSARQFAEAILGAFKSERGHAEAARLRPVQEPARTESLLDGDSERRAADRDTQVEVAARAAAQEHAIREVQESSAAKVLSRKEAEDLAHREAEERAASEVIARREAQVRAQREAEKQAQGEAEVHARAEAVDQQSVAGRAAAGAAMVAANRTPMAGTRLAVRTPVVMAAMLATVVALGTVIYSRQGPNDQVSAADSERAAAKTQTTAEVDKRGKAGAFAGTEAEQRTKNDAELARKADDAKLATEIATKASAEAEAKKLAEDATKAEAATKDQEAKRQSDLLALKTAPSLSFYFDSTKPANENAEQMQTAFRMFYLAEPAERTPQLRRLNAAGNSFAGLLLLLRPLGVTRKEAEEIADQLAKREFGPQLLKLFSAKDKLASYLVARLMAESTPGLNRFKAASPMLRKQHFDVHDQQLLSIADAGYVPLQIYFALHLILPSDRFSEAVSKRKPSAILPNILTAAEKGYANAQRLLGFLYVAGVREGNSVVVPQDRSRALYWYSKAADQGHEYSIDSFARMLIEENREDGKRKRGLELVSKLDTMGFREAKLYMSYLLANGIGVERSDAKARAYALEAIPLEGRLREPYSPPMDHRIKDLGIRVPEESETELRGLDKAFPSAGNGEIKLSEIRFEGNTVYSQKALLLQSRFSAGTGRNLDGWLEILMSVRSLYRANGYFLAQVSAIPEVVSDGVLKVRVFEGRIGNVSISQSTASPCLPVNVIAPFVAGLVPTGSLVTESLLEGPLLALGDVLPCTIQSSLSPSARVGFVDFSLNLQKLR